MTVEEGTHTKHLSSFLTVVPSYLSLSFLGRKNHEYFQERKSKNGHGTTTALSSQLKTFVSARGKLTKKKE